MMCILSMQIYSNVFQFILITCKTCSFYCFRETFMSNSVCKMFLQSGKRKLVLLQTYISILYDLFSLLFAAKIATEMNILFPFFFFAFSNILNKKCSFMCFQKPHRLLPTNLYVILYNFKARHPDELDLKAGYKVSKIIDEFP